MEGQFIRERFTSYVVNECSDHDGDTGSADFTYSDESVKEVDEYLNNLDTWFVGEKVRFFGSTDTLAWVLKSMSM